MDPAKQDELTFTDRYRVAKMIDAGRPDRRIMRQAGCPPEYVNNTRERLQRLGIATAQQLLVFDYVSTYQALAQDSHSDDLYRDMAIAFGTNNIAEIQRHVTAFLQNGPKLVENRLQLDYSLNMQAIPPKEAEPKAEVGLRDLDPSHSLIHPEHWPGTMSQLVDRLWKELLIELENENVHGEEAPSSQEAEDRATALYQACEMQTKRIIIDTDQFNVFVRSSDQELPPDAFADLRWPFDSSIYIELTQSTLYRDEGRDVTFLGLFIFGAGDVRTVCFAIFVDDTFHLPAIDIDIKSGLYQATPDENPPESPTKLAKVACMVITYLTARAVKVVEEPLTRNVRRRLERKQLPNPFHVVTTHTPRAGHSQSDQTGQGSPHSYRYDVIGHIRFGRHLLADGTHRVTREWVRPHQRGLRNLRYIPATRRYSADAASQESERARHGDERVPPTNAGPDDI